MKNEFKSPCYLGIDFGTSGARVVVIDSEEEITFSLECAYEKTSTKNWAFLWEQTLYDLIRGIPPQLRATIKGIAINGTSATVLLCDQLGSPIDAPIFYNDTRAIALLPQIAEFAPPNHLVLSPTSSLAKMVWWYHQQVYTQASYFLHQADWLAFLLHGKAGISDYHNALKLGYDVYNLCYPPWLEELPFFPLLPEVWAPGKPIGEIKPSISQEFNLPSHCLVFTGTTDSIAAFLASKARGIGEAVTSLGSTLVIKLLTSKPVESATYGIYSHRLGNLWLTGGASNTGGAVLRHFFTDGELETLSQQIQVYTQTGLDYYPLISPGERFPINDPHYVPKIEPRPSNPVEFLHGLLEGIAKIEARGYQLLQDLGCDRVKIVYTAGGGAKNTTWTKIRQNYLKVPVIPSKQTAAAFGTALLAKDFEG